MVILRWVLVALAADAVLYLGLTALGFPVEALVLAAIGVLVIWFGVCMMIFG